MHCFINAGKNKILVFSWRRNVIYNFNVFLFQFLVYIQWKKNFARFGWFSFSRLYIKCANTAATTCHLPPPPLGRSLLPLLAVNTGRRHRMPSSLCATGGDLFWYLHFLTRTEHRETNSWIWLTSIWTIVECFKCITFILHWIPHTMHSFFSQTNNPLLNCLWMFICLVFGRTIYHLVSSRTYWLTVLLITVLALLPRFMHKVIWQIFWPSDIQIAREAEVLGKVHNNLGSKLEQDVS